MEQLQELDFDIEYINDNENIIANALSRQPMANASHVSSWL